MKLNRTLYLAAENKVSFRPWTIYAVNLKELSAAQVDDLNARISGFMKEFKWGVDNWSDKISVFNVPMPVECFMFVDETGENLFHVWKN